MPASTDVSSVGGEAIFGDVDSSSAFSFLSAQSGKHSPFIVGGGLSGQKKDQKIKKKKSKKLN